MNSGTADTYFHQSIAASIYDSFKKIVGVNYNINGMKLSDDQVRLSLSIVVQLEGTDIPKWNFDLSNPDAMSELARKLDPSHPNDVLVAVLPNHYLEFDSRNKKYISR